MENNTEFTLDIDAIEIPLYLGISEAEKQTQQSVSIKLLLNFHNMNIKNFADNINKVICYDEIISFVIEEFSNKRYNLLETLCWTIKSKILEVLEEKIKILNIANFTANNVKVTVYKSPKIPKFNGQVSCTV